MNYVVQAIGLIDHWQTLATGILALGAAFWAGRPVYHQLKLMRLQNNVMVRSTIGDMVLQLDAHANSVERITKKPLHDIHYAVYNFERFGPPKVFGEWASQEESSFRTVDTELKALFVQSLDVQEIEDCKAALLAAVDGLTTVLWEIYLPDYAENFPEDINWTDEERAAANARSTAAEGEVEDKANAVSHAVRHLKEAYAGQRAALICRLRLIDDSLLA